MGFGSMPVNEFNVSLSRPLTEAEFEEFAKPTLLQLCAHPDPVGLPEPFFDKQLQRRLIFPLPFPDQAFFDGMRAASARLGERGFFLSINGLSAVKQAGAHHYVLFEELAKYPILFDVLDYTMYSTKARWAFIANTLEMYGLLACDAPFLEDVKQYHPDLDEEGADFIDFWLREKRRHSSARIDWIFPLLGHVYGRNEAAHLILHTRKNFRFESPRSSKIHVIDLTNKKRDVRDE